MKCCQYNGLTFLDLTPVRRPCLKAPKHFYLNGQMTQARCAEHKITEGILAACEVDEDLYTVALVMES